jgi:hypothetical protein
VGKRGVKIAIGGNGASVCSRSVAFFEVFTESDISARKEKKRKEKLAGNSSAGPPSFKFKGPCVWRRYHYHRLHAQPVGPYQILIVACCDVCFC